MNKLNILILLNLLILSEILNAQDCDFYYPQEIGDEIELQHFDQKDKLIGTSLQKIKDVHTISGGREIVITSTYTDKKGEVAAEGDFSVKCTDGVFYFDMTNYLNQQNMEAYKDMEVEVTSDELDIPKNAQPGTKLKDGKVTMNIKNGGMPLMNMTINIFNRKIEGTETITTPAGTFDCLKITYDSETKMIATIRNSTTEYYAKNAGMVKSESYNKNGKLTSYSILSRLKN